jgi:hypothetical protein
LRRCHHAGHRSGRRPKPCLVLKQKAAGKNIYVLASHSHFFMDGIFNTPYWNGNGGVLEGWIVGAAGAVRYRLPAEANMAKEAMTDVYGYLLAIGDPKGPRSASNSSNCKRRMSRDTR